MSETKKKSETVVEKFFLDNENGKRKADEWIENKSSKLGHIEGLTISSKPVKGGFIRCFIEK